MSETPSCPKCNSTYVYPDPPLWVCPECANEWPQNQESQPQEPDESIIRDASGNELQDGDSVVVIKDLKVKGASKPLKIGTKVKSIRLVESSDGHNIACKIDGFGAMKLKSEFVKKS